MTRQEMHDWFDLVWDKYDSVYFTDDEKDSFLNRAMLDYVNELAFGRDKQGNGVVVQSVAEMSQGWEHTLHPLIKEKTLTTNASGKILMDDINSSIVSGAYLLSILAIRNAGGSSSIPIKYVRHNDWAKFNQNYFKKATESYPQYSIKSDGVTISPTPNEGTTYKIMILRTPLEVSSSRDCELPSFTHNKIVAKALAISGIPAENPAMATLDQITD